MIICEKIMIGTIKVGRRLSGSSVSAAIDRGSDIANLPAI